MRLPLFTLASILLAVTASTPVAAQKPPDTVSRPTQSAPPSKDPKVLVVFPTDDYIAMTAKTTGQLPTKVFASASSVGALIDSDQLAKSFQEVLEKFGKALTASTTKLSGGYEIDQIEIQLQITAEGSVGILATGGKAGMTGGISVVLKRPTKP